MAFGPGLHNDLVCCTDDAGQINFLIIATALNLILHYITTIYYTANNSIEYFVQIYFCGEVGFGIGFNFRFFLCCLKAKFQILTLHRGMFVIIP